MPEFGQHRREDVFRPSRSTRRQVSTVPPKSRDKQPEERASRSATTFPQSKHVIYSKARRHISPCSGRDGGVGVAFCSWLISGVVTGAHCTWTLWIITCSSSSTSSCLYGSQCGQCVWFTNESPAEKQRTMEGKVTVDRSPGTAAWHTEMQHLRLGRPWPSPLLSVCSHKLLACI